MKKRVPAAEAGFSVAIVILALVLLTFLGFAVIRSVDGTVKDAGDKRVVQNALYIAEAGVAWGLQTLREAPYNLEVAGGANEVFTLLIGADITDASSNTLNGWRQLGTQSFGGGTFRVAVRDDEESDADLFTDTNQRFLLRALGTDASGNQRMIEVAMAVAP